MTKLKELISLCKASVTISTNNHKDNYQTIDDYVNDLIFINEDIISEIGNDVYEKMIELDTIIVIYAYPLTPIGSYIIYHYDVDEAIDIALRLVKQDL